MASRALGAFLALAAAALFVVSIAASAFWAGYPVVEGKQITAKHVHVGPLGATGCNVGGDGSCESITLQSTAKLVGYATLGATALATVFAVLVLFAAARTSERRKGVALASLVFALVAAAGGGAMLALGPGIEASQRVEVPIGWGAFVFGGGVLASLLASLVTRALEPEPLRLKSSTRRSTGAPPARTPAAEGAIPGVVAGVVASRSSRARLVSQAHAMDEAQRQAQAAHIAQTVEAAKAAHAARASQSRIQRPSQPAWDPPAPQPAPQPVALQPVRHPATRPPPQPARHPASQPPPQPAASVAAAQPVAWQAARTKAPSAAPEPVHPFARTKPPSAGPQAVNPFARTQLPDEPQRNPAADDPLMPSGLPDMPPRAKAPSAPPPMRAKPPSMPPPARAKAASVPPPVRAQAPSVPPPVRNKPPSIAPPKKPVVPAPAPRTKAPSANDRSGAHAADRSGAHAADRSGGLRPSTEQGPSTPPPKPTGPRGSMAKITSVPPLLSTRSPTVAHAVPPPPAIDKEPDELPSAKRTAIAAAALGDRAPAKASAGSASAASAAKRRSDTEMRTGKNAIAEATETDLDAAPSTRADTASDVSDPPHADAAVDVIGSDTDAELAPAPARSGAPASAPPAPAQPKNGGAISAAEMEKLVAQASAPDPTAQTLLAPDVKRRDPQDLMATMERAPRTPIPTLERTSPPTIDSTDRPVQVPLSTAPASLPPPKDLDAEPNGPSPACPQCEAPMGWVDEHLRFYCRACRMYF